MAVYPTDLSIMIRSDTDTIRIVPLGGDTDFELRSLDSNIDSDSLTFNARGVCGVAGNGITLASRVTSYLVTFNSHGRWRHGVRRGPVAGGSSRECAAAWWTS